MSRSDQLFSHGDLGSALRVREQKLSEAAQVIPADHALATSAEDLAAALVDEYQVEPIILDEAAMTIEQQDERIDVRSDRLRFIQDQSRPFYVPGTRFTLHVPFSGDADLFKFRPSHFTSSLPSGVVSGTDLLISASAAAPIERDIKAQVDGQLNQIKEYVATIASDVAAFNARLTGVALPAATRRREKVIADHDLAASFGVPVRRADAPRTYVAPPVGRQVNRAASATRGSPNAPLDPALSSEVYEDILAITRQMAAVMERSPKAFATMGEEDLRQHFLVQLNGQYEGDATGETFNFEGKTDILIRRKGRNIFVGECKFWGGPKKLTETIDQILGYLSWRDTKAAIFVFNRGRELSQVLAQISPTVTAHPAFVRELAYGVETDFRFVIRHRDDPERELTLSVLVFEVSA